MEGSINAQKWSPRPDQIHVGDYASPYGYWPRAPSLGEKGHGQDNVQLPVDKHGLSARQEMRDCLEFCVVDVVSGKPRHS
jgi:hypothetical protein